MKKMQQKSNVLLNSTVISATAKATLSLFFAMKSTVVGGLRILSTGLISKWKTFSTPCSIIPSPTSVDISKCSSPVPSPFSCVTTRVTLAMPSTGSRSLKTVTSVPNVAVSDFTRFICFRTRFFGTSVSEKGEFLMGLNYLENWKIRNFMWA